MATTHTVTTHRYFDLFGFIDSIVSPEIAAPVAVSIARKVDFMITSAARSVFKVMKADMSLTGIDLFAEMQAAVDKVAYSEAVFDEYGSTNVGDIYTIKELMVQREMWHALAKRLTPLTNDFNGRPKVYTERTLEDQILAPTPGKVAVKIQNRFRIQTSRNAEAMGMPEAAAGLLKKRLAAAEADKVRMTENLKEQGPAVLMTLDIARRYDLEDIECTATAEFTSLSVQTQLTLLQATAQAIDLAETWATNNNTLSDTDWDIASLCATKASAEIKSVMQSPTYVNHAQQLEAAATNVG